MSASSIVRAGLAAALCGLAAATAAHAAMPADLSGVWQYDRDAARNRPKPSLTPDAAALVAKKAAARQAGWVREVQNLKCLPTGMPLLMQWISPIYIFQDYHRVAIITENDPGADQPRTIYLDDFSFAGGAGRFKATGTIVAPLRGQDVRTTYDFSKADRILSLGSDLLNAWPGNLRYARDYAAKRRENGQSNGVNVETESKMSRLYVAESTFSVTGTNADERLQIKPSLIPAERAATSKKARAVKPPLTAR